MGAFDRLIHIGIGEDDVGALAAELERDALEIGVCGGFHDQMADFGRTGEGDLVDIHVLGDGGARGWAEAGQRC